MIVEPDIWWQRWDIVSKLRTVGYRVQATDGGISSSGNGRWNTKSSNGRRDIVSRFTNGELRSQATNVGIVVSKLRTVDFEALRDADHTGEGE